MKKMMMLLAVLSRFSFADGTNDDFTARCQTASEQAAATGTTVIEGRDGWLFFAPELRHLGAGRFWGDAAEKAGRSTRADARDPLPAILDFHRALAAKGVTLILVPVPPKAVVHARQLFDLPPGARPDPHHQEFYALLRSHGLTVLDLTEPFREWGGDRQGPPYCRQDTHWSGAACVEAARQIAALAAPLLANVQRENFSSEWRTTEITGDLWSMLAKPDLPKEKLPVRIVSDSRTDPGSPVILMGDSHTLIFQAGGDMQARGAGLADQLAVELGIPVDLIGVRGSGATPARINLFRRAQQNPSYWDNKRIVVWVFAAREFTESDGWRIVPIAP